jgi:hypothetical protein
MVKRKENKNNDSNEENTSLLNEEKRVVYVKKYGSTYLINILLILATIYIAISIQQKIYQENIKNDIDLVKIKQDILDSVIETLKTNNIQASNPTKQDDILDDTPKKEEQITKNIIGGNVIEDESYTKFNSDDSKTIVIDGEKLKLEAEKQKLNEKKLEEKKRRIAELEVKKKKQEQKQSESNQDQIPPEVKNFKSSKISKIKPKKMWIPIPNR